MRIVRSACVALVAVISALVVRSLYASLEYLLGGSQYSLPAWTSSAVGLAAYLAIPMILAYAVLGIVTGLATDRPSRMTVSGVAAVLFAVIVLLDTTWYTNEARTIDITILVIGAAVGISVAHLLGRTREKRAVT